MRYLTLPSRPNEIFDQHMDARPNPEMGIVLDVTGYHEKDRLSTIAFQPYSTTKYTRAIFATA
jgi:hypothetical protein